ncbi:MAG: T9SS type A sorting domain-containing protein, partial [Bacteroidota bacterium]
RGGDEDVGYERELEESYVFLDDLAEDTRYEFRIETECDEEIVFTEVFEFTTKSGDLTTSIDNKISDRGRGIINLYPNPTKRLFNMVYNSKEGDYLDVQVQNNLGQVVYRNAYPLIQGDTNIRVQVPSVPDGIYYVRTTSMKAREQHYRKLMISSE